MINLMRHNNNINNLIIPKGKFCSLCPHYQSNKCYAIPSMPSYCTIQTAENYNVCGVYLERSRLANEGWKFR